MNLDKRAQAASQGIQAAVGGTAFTKVAPSTASAVWRNVASFAVGFAVVAVLIVAVIQLDLLPAPEVVSPDLPSISLPGIEDPTIEPGPPITEAPPASESLDSNDATPADEKLGQGRRSLRRRWMTRHRRL